MYMIATQRAEVNSGYVKLTQPICTLNHPLKMWLWSRSGSLSALKEFVLAVVTHRGVKDCWSPLTVSSCSRVKFIGVYYACLRIHCFWTGDTNYSTPVGGTCFKIAVVSLYCKEHLPTRNDLSNPLKKTSHAPTVLPKRWLYLQRNWNVNADNTGFLTSWKGEEIKPPPEKQGHFLLLCACSIKPPSSAAVLSQEWNKGSFLLAAIIKSYAVFCSSFLG